MSTPHIEFEKKDISNIIIMSGDPLRSKYIAENYLEDYKLVNNVRAMYAYTGFYKGKKITVMGHGMGMSSMCIYAYELFKFYDVDVIIRVGTCGTFIKNIEIGTKVLANKTNTTCNFAYEMYKENIYEVEGFDEINRIISEVASKNKISLLEDTVTSSLIFDAYSINENKNKKFADMEAFALFLIAKKLNKKSACLLNVTDNLITDEHLSSEEREKDLNEIILIALESTLKL